ncbi:hypothetical protein ACFLTV_01485 [Chloroflexota bacterium]
MFVFQVWPQLVCISATVLTMAVSILACSPATDGAGSTNGVGKPRSAIIDQLYNLQPNEALISEVTQQLEDYGFGVDLYQGDEVTVDFYRQLPSYGYSLIIFRVHSGILGPQGRMIERTRLFTNEPYSETKHVTEQLTEQLVKARINEHYPWVFGIESRFIKASTEGRFRDTVVIVMGCATLYLDDMAQAFIQKGASAYLGWDATVGLGYVDEATSILITNLCADLTISKAVAETMDVVGPDPDYIAYLRYYPRESGDQTIKALAR